jgi:hypothetical protein
MCIDFYYKLILINKFIYIYNNYFLIISIFSLVDKGFFSLIILILYIFLLAISVICYHCLAFFNIIKMKLVYLVNNPSY